MGPFRGRRTGVGFGCSPARSNSGRVAVRGCTIGCATRGTTNTGFGPGFRGNASGRRPLVERGFEPGQRIVERLFPLDLEHQAVAGIGVNAHGTVVLPSVVLKL